MYRWTLKHVLKTVTEGGDASDDEEDLEVGGVTQDYKCPISLTTLVNPMTSYVTGMYAAFSDLCF